ncbi:lipoxygenase family protein [Nodularia harveyana UHCC-0300]|uniref:Lipoxygenase family protein n=1 Tax=Nodularia harveyana UHCC-0300 TaxID=2974287 RepID=A0ABU5UHF9_9CYAN|nr:lipoxygenase family protein [Nodularia harveyana]MEA5582426.1 lipoxygenase family protein [Nodularia harveyana UHCC-0300]
MFSRNKQQKHQKLVEQYVLSRRTMLALLGFVCAPGLENLMVGKNPSKPTAPSNPQIPTLPQDDSPTTQQERQQQLQQARQEYEVALRLPASVRVATLPQQEAFSPGYNNNRGILSEKIGANQQAFFQNPQSFLRLEDYEAVFPVLPLPDVAKTFREDATFSQQRLSGPNPMELTNVLSLNYPLTQKLQITDEMFQAVLRSVRGRRLLTQTETIKSATENGSLFVTDYAVLDSDTVTPQENKFLAAPIALYFADRIGGKWELIPIAIQLGQVPGVSLLCTPLDGVDWTLAKMIAQMADFYTHELVRHLGQTHLALEPIALATVRELSTRHPVNVLLKPHFEFTMAINAVADQALINPGGLVDIILGGTLESSLNLANQGVSEVFNNFSKFALPNNLRQRGVDDRSRLRNFPYRDDGLLIWQAIEDYVSQYIGIYYRSNRDVREDFELQNWVQTLRKPVSEQGFGVVSLPPQLTNRDQLIDILTQIIFTAGPQHSAIAWVQYQYMSFVPNMPGAIYQPIPTIKGMIQDENSLISFLPGVEPTFAQVNVMSVIGTKQDPKAFADFGVNSFQDFRAINVLRSFQTRLKVLETIIEQRNKRRPECYPGFLPSRMANSTSG